MDGTDALALPFGDDPTYSVGELNAAISDALRAGLPTSVWVRGEVSHFRVSGNGHAYFDVIEKDARRDGVRAVLNVALFRTDRQGVNRALRDAGVQLAEGVEVRIRGRVELYSPTGRLQLIMTAVDPVFTVGRMAANRARLLQTLADEGLLRANAARVLPMVPLRVGLVTSGGSAAYHDFVHELEASAYAFRVALCAVRVQGAAADRRIAYALRQLAPLDLDVVVVARGGGSRADLAAFDSEVVARAIATMPVPVLTGIGHEVDRTVADEVAHTVAKTPTAAAGMLIDRVAQFDHALRALSHRVVTRAGAACDHARHRVDRLRHRAVARGRAGTRDAQRVLSTRQQSILAAARRGTRDAARTLDADEVRLRALDPRRVLERGYSITRDPAGAVVRSAGAVTPDAILVTEVADGTITSRVVEERATMAESERPWWSERDPAGRPGRERATHGGGVDVSEETIGYAEAMRELEGILDELEGDDLDVDVLAVRVRRASELIQVCRARITRAEDDVATIVTALEDFDPPDDRPQAWAWRFWTAWARWSSQGQLLA